MITRSCDLPCPMRWQIDAEIEIAAQVTTRSRALGPALPETFSEFLTIFTMFNIISKILTTRR